MNAPRKKALSGAELKKAQKAPGRKVEAGAHDATASASAAGATPLLASEVAPVRDLMSSDTKRPLVFSQYPDPSGLSLVNIRAQIRMVNFQDDLARDDDSWRWVRPDFESEMAKSISLMEAIEGDITAARSGVKGCKPMAIVEVNGDEAVVDESAVASLRAWSSSSELGKAMEVGELLDQFAVASSRYDRMAELRAEAEYAGSWPDLYMNYAYPIEIRDEATAAQALSDWSDRGLGGCVELARNADEDYFLFLTGGGMDLTDHICGAYVALGAAPPAHFAENFLTNFRMSPSEAARLATSSDPADNAELEKQLCLEIACARSLDAISFHATRSLSNLSASISEICSAANVEIPEEFVVRGRFPHLDATKLAAAAEKACDALRDVHQAGVLSELDSVLENASGKPRPKGKKVAVPMEMYAVSTQVAYLKTFGLADLSDAFAEELDEVHSGENVVPLIREELAWEALCRAAEKAGRTPKAVNWCPSFVLIG